MGRLQELANQAAAARPKPPALRRWSDVVEAVRPHAYARRLALNFAAARLQADLDRIDQGWWVGHQGPYHDGHWESVALWAPRGDRREQRSFGGAFAETEALARCPYIREVIAAFPCEKNRVRLMRLRPGGHILRHSDPLHQIDPALVRVHVPIVTSPAVRFMVSDRRVIMNPGEVWHVDVRFPHEVHNQGDAQRVHLVIDLIANRDVSALLRQAEAMGRGFLLGYYVRHSLPAWARKQLKVGN